MESMKCSSTIESRGRLLVVRSFLERGTTDQVVQEPLIMEPQRHECVECWKSFNSTKALHGHMRKHPERSYQGINPPSPSLDVAAPNMAEESCQISLRERMEAFYEDWDTETYYEGDGADYETRYWRCMIELDNKNKMEEEAALVTVVASEMTPKATLMATSSKKMKLAGEIAKSWGHLCDTCGKSFSSPQVLGGHKACHRKTSPTLSLLAASEAKVGEDAGKAKGAYVCKFCQKGFPSGQALGGHKRLHWQGASITTLSPTEDLTSSTLKDSPKLTSSATITSSLGNEGTMVTADDQDSHNLDLELRLRL